LTKSIIVIIIKMMEGLTHSKNRKHSRKRDEILAVIRSTASHPSARWVYERLRPAMPALSLGTVYRNISLFQEEGELVSLGVVQGEERFDGRVEPHPHFVCSRCGKIIDIPEIPNETLESIGDLGKEGGLKIEPRRTVFFGLCGDCQASSRASSQASGSRASGSRETP
jgi:Fur family peroxide stress response transcriptional regulator